ncbi:MAG: barstar family protein [Peptococcaceae bacterium]|nr:barstar family protein [Peptococcaceae bacterium]MBQ5862153.1 barstar family protein [Peptococcaceae bacterium]
MDNILTLNLDGTVLKSKEELHSTISWQLQLTDYYGRNLDAFWDVLSAWNKPLIIKVTNTAQLYDYLGDYAQSLLELLRDVAAENSTITLIIS